MAGMHGRAWGSDDVAASLRGEADARSKAIVASHGRVERGGRWGRRGNEGATRLDECYGYAAVPVPNMPKRSTAPTLTERSRDEQDGEGECVGEGAG